MYFLGKGNFKFFNIVFLRVCVCGFVVCTCVRER